MSSSGNTKRMAGDAFPASDGVSIPKKTSKVATIMAEAASAKKQRKPISSGGGLLKSLLGGKLKKRQVRQPVRKVLPPETKQAFESPQKKEQQSPSWLPHKERMANFKDDTFMGMTIIDYFQDLEEVKIGLSLPNHYNSSHHSPRPPIS